MVDNTHVCILTNPKNITDGATCEIHIKIEHDDEASKIIFYPHEMIFFSSILDKDNDQLLFNLDKIFEMDLKKNQIYLSEFIKKFKKVVSDCVDRNGTSLDCYIPVRLVLKYFCLLQTEEYNICKFKICETFENQLMEVYKNSMPCITLMIDMIKDYNLI